MKNGRGADFPARIKVQVTTKLWWAEKSARPFRRKTYEGGEVSGKWTSHKGID